MGNTFICILSFIMMQKDILQCIPVKKMHHKLTIQCNIMWMGISCKHKHGGNTNRFLVSQDLYNVVRLGSGTTYI